MGSIFVARRAGTAHADRATSARIDVTAASTIGSLARTPTNWVSRLLHSATAPSPPTASRCR